MHELSIAQALVHRLLAMIPPGQRITGAVVRAGPMRGIEPQAMDWAWQAAIQNTPLDGARLELLISPWRLHCPDCQRTWPSSDLFATCSCGSQWAYPVDSDELSLIRLEVEPITAVHFTDRLEV